MRYNDYTDLYTFNAFKALTSSEKSALLVKRMLPHTGDNFKELAKRGTLVAMMALFVEERDYGFLPFDNMTFKDWLDVQAVQDTNNERWAATPSRSRLWTSVTRRSLNTATTSPKSPTTFANLQ